MAARNAHWTNLNEGRAYPIDDAALLTDTAGKLLPPNLLVDLNLRWPSYLGNYAFLAGISSTPTLVSLVVQVTHDLDSTAFAPLAVLSVPKPVTVGRMYAISSQVAGVGGWAVLGGGTQDLHYAGRFLPRSAFFAPRAARPYRELPVQSVSVLFAETALTGVVLLRAEAPLTLTKESREIHGIERDCIVLRLDDSGGADGFPTPDAVLRISGYKESSAFQTFAGPCASRPESGTCGDPQPIQFLNTVSPDCNGGITLRFQGCAQVAKIEDPGGIAVDCNIGLVDSCLPPQLPSSAGLLPGEYDPANIPPYVPPTPAPDDGSSAAPPAPTPLPYLDCFDEDGSAEAVIAAGRWEVVADDSAFSCPGDRYGISESIAPGVSLSTGSATQHFSYASATAAMRNVLLFDLETATNFRRIQSDVALKAGPSGAKRNGGIVLNYREHPANIGQFVYVLVEIDYDSQFFRISRFNGTLFQALVTASVPGIQLDKWYRLVATIKPASAGQVTVTADLTAVDDGSVAANISVTTDLYGVTDGSFGFATNRAISRFSYVNVVEDL